MKIAVVVQARMTSQRLPGKVLKVLGGGPLLARVWERVRRATTVDEALVATSDDRTDDALADFCQKEHIGFFRGSLTDVAGRFKGVFEKYGLDAFVRISGDSPFIDPALIDDCVRVYRKGDHDIVTDVLKRTFPRGQSVEVVGREAFFRAYPEMRTEEDREHVTPYFYRSLGAFRIFNLESGGDFGAARLTVDTPQDMLLAERMMTMMKKPHWEYGWRELLELQRAAAAFEGRA
ncbi:MAG TPA: NTP transferase domain-containing protein [Elusimicrobiota bacterium]|nr:NTP transferase domain-containing protein [Elusimicrobiota bacterium]